MGKRKAVIFAFCCGAVVLLTACGQSSQELAKTPGEYVKRAEELILSGETKGNLSDALKDYEKALKLDERSAEAYLGAADVYIRRLDFEQALQILQTGLDKTGGDPDIAAKIKELESGNVKDSQGRLRRRSIYSEDGQLLRYYALTYDESGINDSITSFDASGAMTGFVKLDPDRSDGRVTNAVFGERRGNVVPEIQELDAEGRVVKRTRYYADWAVNFSEIYTYDQNGRVIREDVWNQDGKLTSYQMYKYDGSGQMTEEWFYDADGSLHGHKAFTYDANGNRIRTDQYDRTGQLLRYATFEYDSRNYLIKETRFSVDGTLWDTTVYQDGQQIGHKDYEGDTLQDSSQNG